LPRFVEVVARAETGETRAQKTLGKIGEYLGIGIANVIMGIGVQQVIVSGRLVYGWKMAKISRMVETGRLSLAVLLPNSAGR